MRMDESWGPLVIFAALGLFLAVAFVALDAANDAKRERGELLASAERLARRRPR